jgi:hypothetical protein
MASAAALFLFAGSAQAGDSDSFVIQGEVPLYCDLINNSVAATEVVDLTITDAQTLGSYTYKCNSADGFERTVESTNGGTLNGTGGSIDYLFSHGGGSGLGFAAQQLTSPVITSLSGSPAYAAGQTGSVRFQLPASAAGEMAGTYSDTVTVSIVAN